MSRDLPLVDKKIWGSQVVLLKTKTPLLTQPHPLKIVQQILNSSYTSGVDKILSCKLGKNDSIEGVFLADGVQFAYSIEVKDGGSVRYLALKRNDTLIFDSEVGQENYRRAVLMGMRSDAVYSTVYVESFLGSLRFDAPKGLQTKANKSGKIKNCTAGKTYPCGGVCRAIGKPCKQALTPEQQRWANVAVQSLKSATAKQQKANSTKSISFPKNVDALEEVKTLGGSTGAKLVRDPVTGRQYVLKKGASPDHIREEFTADRIYEALGANVPQHRLYETSNGPIKLAEYIEGKQLNQLSGKELSKAHTELQKHFAADALLANWDVVGTDYDNVIVDNDGKVYRIDNGGSLRYRAQGTKSGKNFDAAPTELFSMRDSATNGYSAKVFGALPYKEVMAQSRSLSQSKAKVLGLASDPKLKATLDSRFKTLDWLGKSEAALASGGTSGSEVEAFHKTLVQDLKSGAIAKLPTQVQATAQFKGKPDPLKNAPGLKQKFDKLSDAEIDKQYQIAESRLKYSAQDWNQKLQNPAWQKANNAPPPPPPGGRELAAIQDYTGSSYDPINKYLRGKGTGGYGLDKSEIEAISKLGGSGLLQLPSYSKTVYRGTDLSPDILARYEVGKEVTEAAFISTAKQQAKAWGGNTHYIIHPKKKSKSADVQAYSNHKSEAEVLFPPGTKFEVVDKVIGTNRNYGGKYYENLIVLQEV